jgi:hypothetical protein
VKRGRAAREAAAPAPSPPLAPKTGLPDFGTIDRPKSDKSDIGWRAAEEESTCSRACGFALRAEAGGRKRMSKIAFEEVQRGGASVAQIRD